MSKEYDPEKIEAQLSEAFTDEELLCLCYDTDEFKPVYDQLRQSEDKSQILKKLINYADQISQLKIPLDWVENPSTAVYDEYVPSAGSPSTSTLKNTLPATFSEQVQKTNQPNSSPAEEINMNNQPTLKTAIIASVITALLTTVIIFLISQFNSDALIRALGGATQAEISDISRQIGELEKKFQTELGEATNEGLTKTGGEDEWEIGIAGARGENGTFFGGLAAKGNANSLEGWYTGKPQNEKVSITSEGNVGIGVPEPKRALDVNGDLRLSTGMIRRPDDAGNAVEFGEYETKFFHNIFRFKGFFARSHEKAYSSRY